MKAIVTVSDRREAAAIRAGLEDASVRAFVVVMGVLHSLPSKRAQRRVMTYVADYFAEQDGQSDLFPPNQEGNGSSEETRAA